MTVSTYAGENIYTETLKAILDQHGIRLNDLWTKTGVSAGASVLWPESIKRLKKPYSFHLLGEQQLDKIEQWYGFQFRPDERQRLRAAGIALQMERQLCKFIDAEAAHMSAASAVETIQRDLEQPLLRGGSATFPLESDAALEPILVRIDAASLALFAADQARDRRDRVQFAREAQVHCVEASRQLRRLPRSLKRTAAVVYWRGEVGQMRQQARERAKVGVRDR